MEVFLFVTLGEGSQEEVHLVEEFQPRASGLGSYFWVTTRCGVKGPKNSIQCKGEPTCKKCRSIAYDF